MFNALKYNQQVPVLYSPIKCAVSAGFSEFMRIVYIDGVYTY